jgi:hypothetical protein
MKLWRRVAPWALVWLLYVGILLAAALPGGLDTDISVMGVGIPLVATNEQMSQKLGDSDAAVYARGGKEIVEHGWVKQQWYTVLWPPGFFVFQAIVLWLVGADGPALAGILLLTVMVWAAALTLLHSLCRLVFNPATSVLLPLSFLLFPFFREYFLRSGVVFSESLSAALWSAGFLSLLLAAIQRSAGAAILGGMLFAAAAYVRASVDLAMLIGSMIVAIDCVLIVFYGWRIRRAGLMREAALLWTNNEWKAILLALLVFHAVTAPYRVHKALKHETIMFSAGDYYFKYLWQPPEEYTPIQGYILEGGGSVACITSPRICKELALDRSVRGDEAHSVETYKKLAFAALASQPIQWLAHKARYLPKYWFSRPSVTTAVPGSRVPGIVIAIAFLVSLVGLPFALATRLGHGLLFGMAVVYVGHFVIFLFVHYEVRYLYWLQSSSVLFAVVTAVCLAQRRTAKAPSPKSSISSEDERRH